MFGIYYFTSINQKIGGAAEISDSTINYVGTMGAVDPVTPSVEDFIIVIDDENITDTITLNFDLDLDPNENTPQGAIAHNEFGVMANLIEYTGDPIYIKKIYVLAEDHEPVDYCYYDSQNIGTAGYSVNLPMVLDNPSPGSYGLLLDKFSCLVYGGYYIIATAGLENDNSIDINASVYKEIEKLTAQLSLVPDGTSSIGDYFGLSANVNNYNSDSNISITKIYAINQEFPTQNYCTYDNQTILTTGKSVNLMLDRSDNDYSFLLDQKFNCTSPGEYLITLTMHDNDENISYDSNATIQKDIAIGRCVFKTGDGNVSNPYIILTASDLDCVRYNLSKHFKLGANINLSKEELSKEAWYDSTKGWLPIGTHNAAFTGFFDGNNYTIENMYINRQDESVGLFRNTIGASLSDFNLTKTNINRGSGGALISNLENSQVTNINITGNIIAGGFSGGLAGIIIDSNITNSSFTGDVNTTASITGGLIGYVDYENNYSYISNSFYSGDYISSASFSGGLIGDAGGAIIDNCYTTGTVAGRGGCTGGLVGMNYGGVIINSHSSGKIIGGHGGIGGLVGLNGLGHNYGQTISNSYSDAEVIGSAAAVGGLVGGAGGLIINSYARGDVTSNYEVVPAAYGIAGGLAGAVLDYIINCYSTGKVTITYPEGCTGFCGYAGGLTGGGCYDQECSTENSFWDLQTSEKSTSTSGTGLPTAQMKTESKFIDAGWDFSSIWGMDSSTNNGYPYLRATVSDKVCYVIEGKTICTGSGTTGEEGQSSIDGKEDIKIDSAAANYK